MLFWKHGASQFNNRILVKTLIKKERFLQSNFYHIVPEYYPDWLIVCYISVLLFLCFSGSSQSSASPNLPSRTSSATSCPSTVHRDSGSDIESLLNADPGYDSVFRKVRLTAVSLSHIPLLEINVEVFMKNTHCNCNCVYMRVAEWWVKSLYQTHQL